MTLSTVRKRHVLLCTVAKFGSPCGDHRKATRRIEMRNLFSCRINDGPSIKIDSNLLMLMLTTSTSEGRFCWEILVYLQRGICSVDLLRYDLNIGALRKTKMLNLSVLRMGEQLSGSPTAVEHSIVPTILVGRDVYMYIQLLVHIS